MISRSRLLALSLVGACLALSAVAVPALASSPAWLPVAATGPTVIPPHQSEVQRLFVDAEGGTFTLTARRQAATGLGVIKQLGTGDQVESVTTFSGSFAVGQAFEGDEIPTGTTITAINAGVLTLSNAFTPVFKSLTFAGFDTPQTTPPLPYNATAAEVQSALEALSDVGAGNVQVSGGPGNSSAEHPYVIAFGGTLANTNVAQLTPNGGGLTNGGAQILTSVSGGQGTSRLALMVQNIGGIESTASTVTYRAILPNGITELGIPTTTGVPSVAWSCGASTASEIFCTRAAKVGPGIAAPAILATVTAAPGVEGGSLQLEVSGGGASLASRTQNLEVGLTPAKPGMQVFAAGAYDTNGNFDTRAGAHPYSASAAIFANTIRSPKGTVIPAGEFKDITVELPPGFLGNPIAVPQCPESTPTGLCPLDTMVAIVQPTTGTFGNESTPSQVFNTQAPYGYPAKYRFRIAETEDLNVIGSLRSDEDYGLNAASLRTPQVDQVYGTFFTFWGQPADPSHNSYRCRSLLQGNNTGCEASDAPDTSLLTSATNCAEQAEHQPVTNMNATTWQNPGEIFRSSVAIPAVTGCESLHFSATFTFEPSATKADSPASYRTELAVPSEGLVSADPEARTTPEIKDTVVKLPQGVTLNASGADGLQACSESQVGLLNEIDPQTGLPKPEPMPNPLRFSEEENHCPEASKIGTGELKSALLEETLHGALYLAAQDKGNPFGSLFAIYLVIEDPRNGIFIKLPGEVDANKQTGQLETVFHDLPQLPFTFLRLSLKGGNRSALASPTTCGNYVTTATNTPWSYPESGPPTESANGFEINEGPEGGACAKTPQERPFDLGFVAGGEKTEAGASGPFDFQITRPDGSQEIETLQLETPQGLSASLKGIPYCTEAEIKQAEQSTGKQEQEHPACPAASKVGTLTTGAGSGPSPFYVSGNLYLAGPYKGAPISVVAITPAVAGPFDLGNVVVRNAVNINRETAQVSAKSDPIPQFLDGVQLRIRDVRIHLDRNNWTINPTSCEPMSVKLTSHGNSGAVAERSAHFQVNGCQSLGFKPKLTGKVTGPTKRGGLPAFTATLTYPEGHYANLKDVQVALPHSEFLEQAHINTVCTRVQAAAHECPQGSIYGYAEAFTPLLDKPLTGPVFLKSSVHKLPDLAIALKGPENQPVEVEFAGRIDSIHGQIRDTIEGLPDVPVSKFILRMKGGKKGLLVNSRNICNGAQTKMTVDMTAQNNAVSDTRPPLGNSCGAKKHKKAKKHSKRSHKRALIAELREVF